jgi:RNA polymerase sigma factor (sigma-70 family)
MTTSEFNQFYADTKMSVHGVAMRYLKNQADADEIVNDAFRKFNRAVERGTFRGDCAPKTFVIRIAVNLSLNRYAANKRRGSRITSSLDCETENGAVLGDFVADQSADMIRDIELAEKERRIKQAIASLEPRYRTIIELFSFDHLPYEELAIQLNLNVGTVKSRLARARQALRKELELVCTKPEPVQAPPLFVLQKVEKVVVLTPAAKPKTEPKPAFDWHAPRGSYDRGGKLDSVRALIDGGMGNRAIFRATGVTTNTVRRIRIAWEKETGRVALCACGRPAIHQGWCSVRYGESPYRQQFIKRWAVAQAARRTAA